MSKENEMIQRLKILAEYMKRSLKILMSAPLLFVPVLVGSLAVSILRRLTFYVDIFGWYWIGNLSYYNIQTIIFSFIQLVGFSVIFNLTALSTLDIVRRVILEQEYSVQQSFQSISLNLVNYAVIALLCQLMIFTYVLIPVGITLMIVAIVENTDYMTVISKSFEYVQGNLVDVVLISLVWLMSRFIMVQIPILFSIQIVPDLIIGGALLILYIEK